MPKALRANLVYLMLLIAPLTWGGAFVAAKFVVAELHPMVAASLRFTISFLVLLPILLAWEGRKALPAVRDFPLLALLGLTGIFGYNALFFYGIGATAATDGALIVASAPIITAVLSALFLKEHFSVRQVTGFVFSVLGVMIIVTKGHPEVLVSREVNPADLLFLGCAFTWACYSVAGKRAMAKLSPLAATTFASGIGAVFLSAAAIPHLIPSAVTGLLPSAFWNLLFLAMVASGLSFVFWFVGVNRVGAGRAGVFVNIAPLSAAFWAALFLGERLAPFHVVGAVLVFGGVYLVTRRTPLFLPGRPVPNATTPASSGMDKQL